MSLRHLSMLAVFLIVAILMPARSPAQEGGGTGGADFLIAPPAARVSAMGGVADPLEIGLEAMSYNPAALTALDGMQLQLTIDPLPNEVTNTRLGFGFPLAGGYGAAAVQLLNAGAFTLVNELGQPQATVSVFDAAASIAYGRTIWRSVSLGADLKAVWRSLGGENAFAVAGDLGAAAWFETPHIGQRPKAPTREQLTEEALRQKAGIDAGKQRRTVSATKRSAETRKALEATDRAVADLARQLESAAEDKKDVIAAKKQEAEAKRDAQRAELAEDEKAEAEALAEVDAWYQGELAKAQAAYEKRLADLGSIDSERKTLFSVIDDPDQELSAEMVDANINAAIEKTRGLQQERVAAANQRKAAYDERRAARAEETRKAIAGYEALVEEAVGPRRPELVQEIESLKSEQAQLAEAKDQNKDRLAELAKQVSAKEKELADLAADPWVKRLQERIAAKQKELKQIESDTAAMAQATEKAASDSAARAERDVKDFEALRVSLQKELRKDKLKRELDAVEARNESALKKVHSDYKAKEKQLYLRLLSAMYRHEEKIFQDRLAAVKDDAAIRAFDFQADQEKARETLDDGWAFDERLLSSKIAQLARGLAKGAEEPAELVAARQERADREAAYRKAIDELAQKEREVDSTEKARVGEATAAISAEQTHVRLVYLQTDKPYLNTAIGVGVRNVGTPVKFVSEAVALPVSATASASYAVVNVQDHNLKLTTQVDVPLLDAWSWSVGIGVEYTFASIAYARVGYNVNQLAAGLGAVSAGLGVHLAAGFTEYAVDYAFKPLPDYGFQHSIGVTISF